MIEVRIESGIEMAIIKRAAPTSQKQQNHQPRQARRNNRLTDDSVDCRAHENRLISQRLYLQFLRQRGGHSGQQILDAIHHIQR